MPDLSELNGLLAAGVAAGVAPAMALGLWRGDKRLAMLAAGEADEHTVFDLASLTKPLATALLCLDLAVKGRMPWDYTLGRIYGDPVPEAKRDITIAQLLCHAAGYPAYEAYYTALQKNPAGMRAGLLKAMLMNEPLAHAPGSAALYSDLGYMLLGMMVEEAAGAPLNRAVAELFARVGIDGPRFAPLNAQLPWDLSTVAPCGPLEDRPKVHGQVEDENAFALGGVAGHAGLFGTVDQVGAVMATLNRATKGKGPWPAEAASRLFTVDADTPGSGRTPGFDTPGGEPSAAGYAPPAGLAGHLGFTGTSLWWHAASGSGVVLLTNRVALGRDNEKIKEFRPLVHDAAWRVLGL